jgi:uncharacterized protein (DUF305 family)
VKRGPIGLPIPRDHPQRIKDHTMNLRTTLAITGALGATLVLAGCSSTAGGMDGMSGMQPSPAVSAAASHNQADVSFAQMMIPHHAQAVEMAEMILAKPGIDDRVVDLATRIKQAQDPEIIKMNGFLRSYGQDEVDPTAKGMHDMHGGQMDGMMSDADMQELQQASGAAAAKLFLTQMVQHHTGAIVMAKTEISDGRDPDAVRLARSIVSDQQAEITEMKSLLTKF